MCVGITRNQTVGSGLDAESSTIRPEIHFNLPRGAIFGYHRGAVKGVIRGMSGRLTILIRRIFCRLGFHDFKVIDSTLSFGLAGGTSTFQCRRCGLIDRRPS